MNNPVEPTLVTHGFLACCGTQVNRTQFLPGGTMGNAFSSDEGFHDDDGAPPLGIGESPCDKSVGGPSGIVPASYLAAVPSIAYNDPYVKGTGNHLVPLAVTHTGELAHVSHLDALPMGDPFTVR